MRTIHIITGSKGGIGKTTLALSISAYYIKKAQGKMLLYESNTNNIDFFNIATEFSLEEIKNVEFRNKKGIRLIQGKYFIELGPRLNAFLVLRENPYQLYEGLTDFWRSLFQIYEIIKDDNIQDMIVDTNLSLNNFIHFSRTDEILTNLEVLLTNTRVFIWYVWCLNDFLDIRIITKKKNEDSNVKTYEFSLPNDIQSSLDYYKQISKNHFTEKHNLIHVLNPYTFYKETDFFGSLYNMITSVNVEKIVDDVLKAVIEGKSMDGILLKELIACIANILHYKKKKLTDVNALYSNLKKINASRLNCLILRENYTKNKINFISQSLYNISKIKYNSNRAHYYQDINSMIKKLTFYDEVENKIPAII